MHRRLPAVLAACSLVMACLAPAAAQQVDINAIYNRLDKNLAAGDFSAALIEAQKLEAGLKARFGTEHANYAIALHSFAMIYQAQGNYAQAEAHYQRALAIQEAKLGKDHPDVASGLFNLALVHQAQGKYVQAEPLYLRALAIREAKLGRDHLDVANTLNNLANVYQTQGKYAQAEPHYQRALAIRETKLGRDHPEMANTLQNLANMYRVQERSAQAETLYQRALTIREAKLGKDHPSLTATLYSLAVLSQAQGKSAQAETFYRRMLAIQEVKLGKDHPDVGTTLHDLAIVSQAQGKYAEAETLYQRSLALREAKLGRDQPGIADVLHNLANAYRVQGKYSQAEAHHQRALAIREAKLGRDHPAVANTLNGLANIYHLQGKEAEAEAYFQRALTIQETKLGRDHRDLAHTLNNLANLYVTQWKSEQAEAHYRRALAIVETALGRDHLDVAHILNNLARVSENQGKHAEAEAHYRRSLAIQETKLDRNHPDVARTLNNLAMLKMLPLHDPKVEAQQQRALAILEAKLGKDHPDLARTLNSLAITYHAQGKHREALAYARRASVAVIGHAAAEESNVPQGTDTKSLSARRSDYFRHHVAVLDDAVRQRIEPDAALMRESFEIAQWAGQSAAAAALVQMAARQAKGTGPIAQAVRERQDLERQWQTFDRRLADAVSKGDVAAAAAQRRELSDVVGKLAAIDARLVREFPDYAELVRPKPLPIAAAQSLLAPDEALFLVMDDAYSSFAWLLTKTDARWVRLAVGPAYIAHRVQTLRCGLDRDGEWELSGDRRWKARKQACRELAPDGFAEDELPPFDPALAHALYENLLAPFRDMIRDKHLLIVPTGALASLPWQVLITEKPAAANPSSVDHAALAWLGRRHALTVLPSVASLKALREHAKAGAAGKYYAGIGNPLLLGGSGADDRASRKLACSARPSAPTKVAVRAGLGAGAGKLSADGRADVALLRRQEPLPETADEICDVGRSLAAAPADILLGARATERAVKSLSASGALANYRVLHFATHGLLPHETASIAGGLTEAALLLTPPNQATDEDDGLLTASEVTLLKLNADWVIMSACNTGGGDRSGEALSGLARAFFYAGARALLVSHWYVDSAAAVALTTRTFDEMKRNPKLGRAEALRRSTQALIARGGPFAHPAIWAPFVIVGEGTAR